MKKFSYLVILLLLSNYSSAQTTPTPEATPPVKIARPFKHNFQVGFTLNQASFSDNWKGGGVNSIAFGGFLNYNVKYKNENWDFASDLQSQIGFIENAGENRRKNADRIFYDLKAAYRLTSKWNAFASINFLSQFADGYDYKVKSILDDKKDSLVSGLFAPAYLTSSVGAEYKPIDYFWLRFGVGTLRQTFVLDERISNAGLYGLKNPGDRLRNQAVLQFIANFDKNLAENINLIWRYMVNFDYIEATSATGTMEAAVVHNFNLNLTLKATKYISTNFQVNVIKDPDQDKNTQFSQILSLGMLLNLNRD
jgi:hypothetical protein